MAVFKAFVSTAQREFVAQERAKNPAASQFRVGGWVGGWVVGQGRAWPVALCGRLLLCSAWLAWVAVGQNVAGADAGSNRDPPCSPACPPRSVTPPPLLPSQGYANKKMERLRQGIGPEDIHLVRGGGGGGGAAYIARALNLRAAFYSFSIESTQIQPLLQVDYIAPSEVPGLLREELPQLKQ